MSKELLEILIIFTFLSNFKLAEFIKKLKFLLLKNTINLVGRVMVSRTDNAE